MTPGGFPCQNKNKCFSARSCWSYFAGCSYFAARSLADDAHIVFCPYSYITNPIIRRAMEIDIKGAILVLDEAQYV